MTDKIKGKGFHEDVDPMTNKRNLHCIASEKAKFKKEQVSDASAIAPIEDENKTLRFNDTEMLTGLLETFEDDTDVELIVDTEDDIVLVKVPKEKADELIDFLAENEIKVKEETVESVDKETAAEKVSDTDNKDVAASLELKYKVDNIITDVKTQHYRAE